MALTPLVSPSTFTGVNRSVSVVPSPICPALLAPQHLTPPAVVKAQACRLPAAIALTPLPRPETLTAVKRLADFAPLPSCPSPSLPQHSTPPLVVRTHVNS